MNFKPFNRHIVVDLIEEQKEGKNSLIVLPTDYEKPQSPYAKAIVIEVADDSKFHGKLSVNDVLLLERRMLNKIDVNEFSFYLVLENYVYGRINK
jgi:co-chaperonin GroES (HSP10)